MGDREDPVLAYWKWLMTLPMPFQWPWDDFNRRDQDRKQAHVSFPYIVTVEASADALHEMEEWCWTEFGPKNGKCKKESCWEGNESVEYLDSTLVIGLQIDDWQPEHKGAHYHTGVWTTVWALKTTYEDGFCDFCFKNAEDAIFFKFTFGFDN